MKKYFTTISVLLIFLSIFFINSCRPEVTHLGIQCSSYTDCELAERCNNGVCINTLQEPEELEKRTVEFSGIQYDVFEMLYHGRVSLPDDFLINFIDLSVEYGDQSEKLDPYNGTFKVKLNKFGTSILFLEASYSEEDAPVPIMISVFPTYDKDYFKRENIEFSIRETAVALIFLQPGIATSADPLVNAALLEMIRGLDTTEYLEKVLRDKMTKISPAVIVSGDIDVQNVIAAAVKELLSLDFSKDSNSDPEASAFGLKGTSGDDNSDMFKNVMSKEDINVNLGEVDGVFMSFSNPIQDVASLSGINTLPRWVFYYLDAIPKDAIMPGDIYDSGVDTSSNPVFIVPPRNYISSNLQKILYDYLVYNSDYIVARLVDEEKRSSEIIGQITTDIKNSFSHSPEVTNVMALEYKGEKIKEGFLVGYALGPDSAQQSYRDMDAMWATYFTQIILPMLQMTGNFNDDFKKALYSFRGAAEDHPIFQIAQFLREKGMGLRINDFLKNQRPFFNSPKYNRELFANIIKVLNSAFLGETKSSQDFLLHLEDITGSPEFVNQLKRVSSKIYKQIAPVDGVTLFQGLNIPAEDFTSSVFNKDRASDTYYFKVGISIIDNDNFNYPTELSVCADEICLCETVPGINYKVSPEYGCMMFIPAKDVSFTVGAVLFDMVL